MAAVNFTVTSTAAGYWIAVDQQDLAVNNGHAVVTLAPGKHSITYWFVGTEGNSLSFEGKVGGVIVVQVKESKIPVQETMAGGFKRFEVS
jgi:hypothetical protein